MTYQEQLLNKKWLSKRSRIIADSHWICSNCQNQSIVSRSKKAQINSIKLLHTSLTGIEATPYLKKYAIDIMSIEDQECHSVLLYTHGTLSQENFSTYNLYYEIESEGETTNKVFINAINELYGKNDIKWRHVRGLHVHHKYYQDNLNSWEYPISALMALCWICHEKLHKNEKIKYFDAHGNEKGTFTLCYRCHGAGYFPEFHHVKDGVCFRCEGARYEELIVKE